MCKCGNCKFRKLKLNEFPCSSCIDDSQYKLNTESIGYIPCHNCVNRYIPVYINPCFSCSNNEIKNYPSYQLDIIDPAKIKDNFGLGKFELGI